MIIGETLPHKNFKGKQGNEYVCCVCCVLVINIKPNQKKKKKRFIKGNHKQ